MTTEQRQELYDDLDGCFMDLDEIAGVCHEAYKGQYGELSPFVKKILEDIEGEVSEVQDQLMGISNKFDDIIDEE